MWDKLVILGSDMTKIAVLFGGEQEGFSLYILLLVFRTIEASFILCCGK